MPDFQSILDIPIASWHIFLLKNASSDRALRFIALFLHRANLSDLFLLEII